MSSNDPPFPIDFAASTWGPLKGPLLTFPAFDPLGLMPWHRQLLVLCGIACAAGILSSVTCCFKREISFFKGGQDSPMCLGAAECGSY